MKLNRVNTIVGFLFAGVLPITVAHAQTTWFVDDDPLPNCPPNCTRDGLSWETAFEFL